MTGFYQLSAFGPLPRWLMHRNILVYSYLLCTSLYCFCTMLYCPCRLLSYLTDALNPGGSGRNLFFSYGTDLTLNTQV